MPVRTYSAQVVPGGAVEGRVVRAARPRGPPAAGGVCGAWAGWVAVGHRPDDAPDVVLVCTSCGAVNDPRRATPASDHATALVAPAGLAPTEVRAKSAVERVHALAAQERRWPCRAD